METALLPPTVPARPSGAPAPAPVPAPAATMTRKGRLKGSAPNHSSLSRFCCLAVEQGAIYAHHHD